MVKRMVEEGHLVCNHSKSHPSMASITDFDKFKTEILTLEESYKNVTGKDMPKYLISKIKRNITSLVQHHLSLAHPPLMYRSHYSILQVRRHSI